ncbi:hypothetical protein [Roseimaritima ulvae]|uniref:Uncharacterized protein n=1 Tax=Roseimaritima ulvae TaxID=980254 RepID=A0A5B9R637_9BACT|nr:hypothetical protein [Roseimaritima ulvae]QEG41971.1 hypothetical protein UC8_40000 [Roseimaritima ulvae]
MLMPNPELRVECATHRQHADNEPCVTDSGHKQLAGQVTLMLLFGIAIMLRWLI